MKTFTQPMQGLKEFEDLEAALPKLSGVIQISGCIDAAKPHMMYSIGNGSGNRIIVTFQEQKAKELAEEYRFFDPNVAYYPAKDILFYQSDIRGNVLTAERINALKMMAEERSCTIVTTFDGLMNPMPSPDQFISAVRKVAVGDVIDLEQLTRHLAELGYEKNYQVQTSGEFSVRGGIIDIFPLTEENPFRIELWDDEVDSIRSFDAESQRSIENLDEVHIYPACELVLTKEERDAGIARILAEAKQVSEKLRGEMKTEEAYRVKSAADQVAEEAGELGLSAGLDAYLSYFCEERVSLLDYFGKQDTLVFLDETPRSIERGMATETEFSESMKQRLEKGYILPGQMRELFTCKEILGKLAGRRCISLVALDLKNPHLEIGTRLNIQSKTVNPYNNSFELLIKDLERYKKNGYQVILLSGSRTRAKRLADDLMAEGLNAFYSEDYDHEVKPGEIMTGYGKIKKGYEYPMLKFVVISESDIFGGEKKKKKRKRIYEGEKIASFTDLNIGDYVVHESHGLGIYRGIEKIEVDKTEKDYIKIEYAGGGNLYILATQLEQIQKYAGAGAKKPKLNKLGGQEWNKTKSRVKGAVREIAEDLVKLYAVRQNDRGFAFGPDTVWQKEFEEMFPFEETEDQDLAIAATKADMESTKIMDRLICGDVGYGKTEIAIRAAFKAVQDGKQVAFLVPTTILAQQHYNNFVQRMKDFPVNIDLLCRFRSSAEQKKTIEKLKKGQVDIIIGTHRLLSKDVVYKDLGLLIIDEEQRFGVQQKERLKDVCKSADILTLSATPIPRTLNMALSGIRDMSVIEEAPHDRHPVQTYVMEYDPGVISDAIKKELRRGGQVYYLHNDVASIERVAAGIRERVPEARIGIGHGKMSEQELSEVWRRLMEHEIDVLVCTTIIETGVDVPNANTLIIDNADRMGLSQLHQLRGRVGRSTRRAYAYFTFTRGKVLSEISQKRLAAIREFTEFGSGFKIAMRDLEIRGAGNILGGEQHGHMESVGYDMYLKLLNEAVAMMKGEAPENPVEECTVDMQVQAHIPESYIDSTALRLDVYRRIADIKTYEDSSDVVDELIDRFGEPPESVYGLIDIALLRNRATQLGITEVKQQANALLLYKDKFDMERVKRLIQGMPNKVMLSAGSRPYISVALGGKAPLTVLEDVLKVLCGDKDAKAPKPATK